ncbi:hypothetical protein DIE04_10750 [Burkholderia sp. Bp8994]|uniref:hypothetical protein n=1 Tax=unclassified Burkholderia TaxID=2613784 RepID=UPI000F5B27A0|nr:MULTISPECIES: hypothetical protein [unclassified Burkholderia]RQR98496.1 hypothetical protein DIE04_10750 [Burkholderia sp. Bp8994]RQS35223.1 hypothetical protein DIE01_27315 [Burkholderia sp. Bp8990]RQZ43202.1 hypothetical protein DIE17_28970 [Burkholderia sp. Bp9099]
MVAAFCLLLRRRCWLWQLAVLPGDFDKRIPAEWTAVLNNVLDIASALFIVTALSDGSLLARLLRSRVLQVFGMGCYSVYLWHLPVLRALQIDLGGAGGDTHRLLH